MKRIAKFVILTFLITVISSIAMPALDGGPEPDYPEGVNAPSDRILNRDDMDFEGEWNCLILLVDFDDYPWDNQEDSLFDNADEIFTQEHFENMLFSEGEFAHPGSESEFTGSMRDYYSEVSLDIFTVTGVVTEWIRAPEDYSYYVGDNTGTGNYPQNSQGLLEDIVNIADDDIDFSQFDNDGNGIVDAIFIVHAGPGAEEFGRNEIGNNYIWSHKWQYYMNTDDDVDINEYTIEPQNGSIGVFCHEFGHALGLPDLYDTDGSSEGIGEWGLMGSAGWNYRSGDPAGSCPGHMSAWSKDRLGWLEVVNVTEDLYEEEIPPIAESGVAYRMAKEGNEQTMEYFLLENRRRIGFDEALVRRQIRYDLPAPEGLLITHIDDNMRNNRDDAHRWVDVEEASPIFIDGEAYESLDGNRVFGNELNLYNPNRADDGDLFPGWRVTNEDSTAWAGERVRDSFANFTTPSSNLYNGDLANIYVTNIYLDQGNVFADLSVDAPEEPDYYLKSYWFDDEDGNGNGTIEPGELINLYFKYENYTLGDFSNLKALLHPDGDDIIEVLTDSVSYGDLPAESETDNEPAISIRIAEDAPAYTDIELEIVAVAQTDEFRLDHMAMIDIHIRPPSTWIKYRENPVLRGEANAFDSDPFSPAVIVQDGVVHCWFVVDNRQPDSLLFSGVGYAESEDGGITWEMNDEPMFTMQDSDWLGGGILGIDVYLADPEFGFYLMAISAQNADGAYVLGLASSDDGLSWVIDDNPAFTEEDPYIADLFQGPLSIHRDANDKLVIMFSVLGNFGAPFIARIVESEEDGLVIDQNWTFSAPGNNRRFDYLAVMAPSVFKTEQGWELYYAGMGQDYNLRLGKAGSNDGLNFVPEDGTEALGSILTSGGRGGWQGADWIWGGRVFDWRDSKRMLFTGIDFRQEHAAIGLAATEFPEEWSVSDEWQLSATMPNAIHLDAAYPNPFNSTVTLNYSVPSAGNVTVSIFDLQGRLVRDFQHDHHNAGSYTLTWDGKGNHGSLVGNGMYMVQVTSGSQTSARKIILLK